MSPHKFINPCISDVGNLVLLVGVGHYILISDVGNFILLSNVYNFLLLSDAGCLILLSNVGHFIFLFKDQPERSCVFSQISVDKGDRNLSCKF